jgi:hypothetical protein
MKLFRYALTYGKVFYNDETFFCIFLELLPKPSKIPSPSKLISSVSSVIAHRTKICVTSASLPVPSAATPSSAVISSTTTSPLIPLGISTVAAVTPFAVSKISPSNSHTTLNVITSPSGGVGGGPSVIVKPATPSPKMYSGVTPSSSTASGAKMALMVKNRLEETDPVTGAINSGKETTIEINKDKMGLGLSIVGGSDTLLVRNIFYKSFRILKFLLL